MSFQRILVASDFSPYSEAALAAGVELARRSGAELQLLHAFDVPIPLFNPYAVAVPVDFVKASREAAEKQLEEAARGVEAGGTAITHVLAEAPAARAITERAKEIGADLVVMGTHGRTGIEHALLGSVAERVLRGARCSVLSVKSHGKSEQQPAPPLFPLRDVVVAVDFSELSEPALDAAIALAKEAAAKLHLVHAFDVRIPFVTPYEVAVPDRLITETRDAAARKLEKAVARVEKAGVAVESHLEEVPAASAIARVAEDCGAQLVVMGTHGHGGIKHLLLGSVAERTLRSAPCSVLTVKRA